MSASYYAEGDIEEMLDAFGVDANVDDQWYTRGILDVVDRTMLTEHNGALAGKLYMLTIRTGALGPKAKEGYIVTITRGAPPERFTIHSTAQVDDGAVSQIFLLRA